MLKLWPMFCLPDPDQSRWIQQSFLESRSPLCIHPGWIYLHCIARGNILSVYSLVSLILQKIRHKTKVRRLRKKTISDSCLSLGLEVSTIFVLREIKLKQVLYFSAQKTQIVQYIIWRRKYVNSIYFFVSTVLNQWYLLFELFVFRFI